MKFHFPQSSLDFAHVSALRVNLNKGELSTKLPFSNVKVWALSWSRNPGAPRPPKAGVPRWGRRPCDPGLQIISPTPNLLLASRGGLATRLSSGPGPCPARACIRTSHPLRVWGDAHSPGMLAAEESGGTGSPSALKWLLRSPRRRRAVGGAGNVYNTESREAGRRGRLRRGRSRTLRTFSPQDWAEAPRVPTLHRRTPSRSPQGPRKLTAE